jgi:hypothetical protein
MKQPFARKAIPNLKLAALTAHAGTLTSIPCPTLFATEGISQFFTLGTILDSDNTEPLSNLTVVVSWGDGSAATAGTLTGGNGQFTLTDPHIYAQVGAYTPEVVVTNGVSQTQVTDSVFVADAALTAGAPSTIFSQEGSNFSAVVATFTDQNPNAPASGFSAVIAWGDGTATTGVVIANGNGAFAVNGAHTYTANGAYSPVVTIMDSGGSQLVVDGFAQVVDAPLVAQSFQSSVVTEGEAINGVIASFLDESPFGVASQFTTTINWGDGSALSAGTVITEGAGGFAVSAAHTYLETGQFPVKLSVFDEGGSAATLSGTETVDASPEPESLLIAGAGLATISLVRRRSCTKPVLARLPSNPTCPASVRTETPAAASSCPSSYP